MAMPQQAGGVEVPTAVARPPRRRCRRRSAAAAALANARWNPTKEQVATACARPRRSRSRQIAARLREHGHVEAKNVFYWFQNHKARQRQRQKQDTFAYFTGLLRRPPPLNLLFRPPAGGPPPPYPHHGRLPVPSPAPAAACNNNNADRHGGTSVVVKGIRETLVVMVVTRFNVAGLPMLAAFDPVSPPLCMLAPGLEELKACLRRPLPPKRPDTAFHIIPYFLP
ncbi:hypothetical protein HU200_007559 [Digitaria exilis]|uniref:Homeobox domain-containing protein n=1 Tax=Digitaria exilis TaxID=1010633 RepID=A0A835FQE7_9POAL|nr:hypothetical protein HU200_007559 [Digitaria exilis]